MSFHVSVKKNRVVNDSVVEPINSSKEATRNLKNYHY